MDVKLLNLEEAKARLAELAASARTAQQMVAKVGSPLKYAYGIEFGRHRSGKLARRAGPSNALTDAFKQAQPHIRSMLPAAVKKGPQATASALRWLASFVLGKTLDYLTARVYSIPEPTRVIGHFVRGKRKGEAKTKKLYRRGGDLRRSYYLKVDTGAGSLRSMYTAGGTRYTEG